VLLEWVDVKHSYKFMFGVRGIMCGKQRGWNFHQPRRRKGVKRQILGFTGEKQLPGADRLVMNKVIADDKVPLKTVLHTIRPASGKRSMT